MWQVSCMGLGFVKPSPLITPRLCNKRLRYLSIIWPLGLVAFYLLSKTCFAGKTQPNFAGIFLRLVDLIFCEKYITTRCWILSTKEGGGMTFFISCQNTRGCCKEFCLKGDFREITQFLCAFCNNLEYDQLEVVLVYFNNPYNILLKGYHTFFVNENNQHNMFDYSWMGSMLVLPFP